MSRCNYHTMISIKRRAERDGTNVEVRDNPIENFPEGKEVLVNGRFAAWFAELTEECAC
jgi:hypothetical protein